MDPSSANADAQPEGASADAVHAFALPDHLRGAAERELGESPAVVAAALGSLQELVSAAAARKVLALPHTRAPSTSSRARPS